MPVRTFAVAAIAIASASVACSSADSVWNAEDVGRATAQITQVPPQVACVDVQVAGARTVNHRFDVATGQSSVLAMNGLPIGNVTFTGSAYSVSCASVSASSVPTWLSDATPATLGAGTSVNVALVLHRNGGASVGVDFQDDDAGATTIVCMPGQVMCAGTCANVASDPNNCGTCGSVCFARPNMNPSACVSGACVSGACKPGYADCDGNPANGCETNLGTTNTSCGMCGMVCAAGRSCVMGACQ